MAAQDKTQKIIEIGYWKAVSIVSGAILVSIVGTAFSVGTVLNSDHFALVRAVDDISDLKVVKLDKQVYELQYEYIRQQLDEIKKAVGAN